MQFGQNLPVLSQRRSGYIRTINWNIGTFQTFEKFKNEGQHCMHALCFSFLKYLPSLQVIFQFSKAFLWSCEGSDTGNKAESGFPFKQNCIFQTSCLRILRAGLLAGPYYRCLPMNVGRVDVKEYTLNQVLVIFYSLYL